MVVNRITTMGARGGGGGRSGGGAGVQPRYQGSDYWGRQKGVPNAGQHLGVESAQKAFSQGKTVTFYVAQNGTSPLTSKQQNALKSIGAKAGQQGDWSFTAKSMNGLVSKANKLSGFSIYATGGIL